MNHDTLLSVSFKTVCLGLLNPDMPCLANSVGPDQLASEKPADLDLHCLSFSMQICIGHLGQVT